MLSWTPRQENTASYSIAVRPDEELAVTAATGNGRGDGAGDGPAERGDDGGNVVADRGVDQRVTHDPLLEGSPAGLEFHSIGYHVRAPWSRVSTLDADPICAGLPVSAPTITLDGWFAVLLRLSGPIGLATLFLRGYDRTAGLDQLGLCIPVRVFVTHWDNSDLARDLARYLPAAPLPPLGG